MRAVALEETSWAAEELKHARDTLSSAWREHDPLEPTLPHLSVRLTAELRAELGIPRGSIVTIRRRALGVLLKRSYEVGVAVIGTLLAAIATDNNNLVVGVIGLILVLIAFGPSQHRRPPRGSE